MDELRTMLEAIEDSYVDFVEAMVRYASKKPSRLNVLLDYMKRNPLAHSSDVVKIVSEQKDFWEDAAYMDAC